MAYLLQMCSNNLNQYAKCANESGQVYAADLEDLRTRPPIWRTCAPGRRSGGLAHPVR